MTVARFLSLSWIFSSMLGLWASPASGLTIYRFGGEDRPKPPEEGQAGVDFRQLSWMDFDAEPHGEIIDLAVDSTGHPAPQAQSRLQHSPRNRRERRGTFKGQYK